MATKATFFKNSHQLDGPRIFLRPNFRVDIFSEKFKRDFFSKIQPIAEKRINFQGISFVK